MVMLHRALRSGPQGQRRGACRCRRRRWPPQGLPGCARRRARSRAVCRGQRRARVRPGCQGVDHSSRRVICAHPRGVPAMIHRSGSAAANRVACRSHDAASSGQVTTVSTVAPLASQRRAKAVTAAATAAERPRPMATLRAPRLSASSVIRLNSAPAGPDPALSQARPDDSRGDNVIFPLLPETCLVAGRSGFAEQPAPTQGACGAVPGGHRDHGRAPRGWCRRQAPVMRPSWLSAVTPSSRPISSVMRPFSTFSTVVPVNRIVLPVAAGSGP